MRVTKTAARLVTSGGMTPERNLRMLFNSTLPLRFWNKLYADPSGCWLWRGALTTLGYGTFGSPTRSAHRIIYEALIGPIPDGLTIDHLCRNRACENPWHMEPVTQRENTLRGIGPSAIHAKQTHCVSGHEFTPENVHVYRGRKRICRICRTGYTRARRIKLKLMEETDG